MRQSPLGGVVRDADATVFEKAGEAGPAYQHVVHDPGHGCMTRKPGALRAHPVLELCDERRAQLPAHGEALLGSFAADRALNVEQRIDPLHPPVASDKIGGAYLPRVLPTAMSANS